MGAGVAAAAQELDPAGAARALRLLFERVSWSGIAQTVNSACMVTQAVCRCVQKQTLVIWQRHSRRVLRLCCG